jgi:hypothetical protein
MRSKPGRRAECRSWMQTDQTIAGSSTMGDVGLVPEREKIAHVSWDERVADSARKAQRDVANMDRRSPRQVTGDEKDAPQPTWRSDEAEFSSIGDSTVRGAGLRSPCTCSTSRRWRSRPSFRRRAGDCSMVRAHTIPANGLRRFDSSSLIAVSS